MREKRLLYPLADVSFYPVFYRFDCGRQLAVRGRFCLKLQEQGEYAVKNAAHSDSAAKSAIISALTFWNAL